MSDGQTRSTLRCRILGHKYSEVRDFTQCQPGYYQPVRHCRRCGYEENIIDECVRDDATWAAHHAERMMETDSASLKARRTLSERGWLSGVRTVIDEPVKLSELTCPECDGDDLVEYEERFNTVVVCMDCSEKLELSFRELTGDGL